MVNMNRELSFWQLYFIAHWPHTAALVDLWIHTRGWVYDKITLHSLCYLARARPVVYIAALPCWSAIESPSIAWVAVWKDSKDSRVAAGWFFFSSTDTFHSCTKSLLSPLFTPERCTPQRHLTAYMQPAVRHNCRKSSVIKKSYASPC